MSQLPADGASCNIGKKVSNVGDLCPAVAMVRFNYLNFSLQFSICIEWLHKGSSAIEFSN